MKRKRKKNKNYNENQKSFYFEDYLETNQKQRTISKLSITEDRIYLLFFFFICLIAVFSIKITFISFQNPQFLENKKNSNVFKPSVYTNNIEKGYKKIYQNYINGQKPQTFKL